MERAALLGRNLVELLGFREDQFWVQIRPSLDDGIALCDATEQ
jgi:hypothetical protein